MQETYSYYSLIYSQTKGSKNCYKQPYSYTLFRTKNLQLARQVFIFHLIDKSPDQKLTLFEYQQCKQCIQEGRVEKMLRCDCGKCRYSIEIQQERVQGKFDFGGKVQPFIEDQDDGLGDKDGVELGMEKECVDFQGRYDEDQLTEKIESMEIE